MQTVLLRGQRAQFHTVKSHSFIHPRHMLNFRYTKQQELSVCPQKRILSSEETKRDNNYGSKWESVCNKISPGLTVCVLHHWGSPHWGRDASSPIRHSCCCHPSCRTVSPATLPELLLWPRQCTLLLHTSMTLAHLPSPKISLVKTSLWQIKRI